MLARLCASPYPVDLCLAIGDPNSGVVRGVDEKFTLALHPHF